MSPMRGGVVLFDSANNISAGDKTFASLDSGWCSIGGAHPVRVTSIHDLSSDVLWVTNLTEEQFYRAGLAGHPNFRSEGYLRSTIRHIYSELGVDPLHVSPDAVVRVLATVVQRTIDVATQRYGVALRSKKALNEDFAVALGAPRSQIDAEMYSMFESCAQHAYVRTVITNNYLNNARALTLRRNRLVHARELLAHPVPQDTQWEYIPRHKLPATTEAIEALLERTTTAFMVRGEVKNMNPMVAEVFSVGSGARVIRDWLTDIEWAQARQWAEIEYQGVLMCASPSAPLPQASKLPTDDYAALSYTSCLAAEQIWTAMTMRRGSREDLRYTAAAAWLRAKDRMAMFDYAQKLYSKGLTVSGYGVGIVVVLYPEGGLRHALDVTTDIGLLPPASKLLEARRDAPADQLYGTA